MYADDSVMCCLFPNRCNLFPQTPGVIFSNTMEYINMIIVFSSSIFIVWSLFRLALQFLEVKLKLILSHLNIQSDSWTIANLKLWNNSVIFSTFLFIKIYSWHLDCIVYLYFYRIAITIKLIIYLCPCIVLCTPN